MLLGKLDYGDKKGKKKWMDTIWAKSDIIHEWAGSFIFTCRN